MIYLDNAATTPMFEELLEVFKKYACQDFFNPSADYREAFDIKNKLQETRKELLAKLGAKTGEIIFTGGATESNNLAIMGSRRGGKSEYIFSLGEHPSVYNVAKELERVGFVVHYVGLTNDGQVDYQKLAELINDKTRLVSVMHVSNETGAVNDLKRISSIIKNKNKQTLFHVDGVQAFCKIPFNLEDFNADFYSISAHKFHGPKGVGALYVRNLSNLKPNVFGGGQEFLLRSGTENVAGIIAMGKAAEMIDVVKNYNHVNLLKKEFVKGLAHEGVHIFESQSPYILSLGFDGINGETLSRILQDKGIIVGKGSACSSKKAGNRVLESIGFNKAEVKSHLRVSFSELNTLEEICSAAKTIVECYEALKEKMR